MLHLLTSVSSVRLYIPKDLRPYDNRQLMLKSIQVQSRAISQGVEDISVNHLHFFPPIILSTGGAETFSRWCSSA